MTEPTPPVAHLLTRSGLPSSAADVVEAARLDQTLQYLIATLYDVEAARYVDPALIFSADVDDVPWHRPDDS